MRVIPAPTQTVPFMVAKAQMAPSYAKGELRMQCRMLLRGVDTSTQASPSGGNLATKDPCLKCLKGESHHRRNPAADNHSSGGNPYAGKGETTHARAGNRPSPGPGPECSTPPPPSPASPHPPPLKRGSDANTDMKPVTHHHRRQLLLSMTRRTPTTSSTTRFRNSLALQASQMRGAYPAMASLRQPRRLPERRQRMHRPQDNQSGSGQHRTTTPRSKRGLLPVRNPISVPTKQQCWRTPIETGQAWATRASS